MISNGANPLSTQETDQRFDLLVADAKEYAVFLIGTDGKLLCWNPGAERIFGYQSSEIVGRHFSCLFSPEDIRNGQPEHELKTSSAHGQSDSCRWQIRKDATRFWCQSTMTPLLNENKQTRSFARVMHDLTASEVQATEKKRADDLVEANRGMEEFLAMLSHELRNPLSPILNAVGVQRLIATDNPILQQTGNIIERQVGLMVRLVDDLLDVSRITKGKLRLKKERLDLRIIVNRAAEAVRPLFDARQHAFSMVLSPQPIWIDADPGRLEQILTNLLNNAAKYTDPGGLIQLSVETEAAEAVVRVRDNGIGMPQEMLAKVFGLFTQGEATHSRSHSGLGVGLALVKALVELHDGRVQASSSGVGKGSEFRVRLPALQDGPLEGTIRVAAPRNEAWRPLRVLVVEDNVDAADSLVLLLQWHGYEALVARTGPKGLEAADTFRPDVALLDIGLPGLDGYQVAARLRAKPEFKDLVICAVTAYTPSDADRQRPDRLAFNHHFVKPVSIADLLAMFSTVRRS